MDQLVFESDNEERTRILGAALAAALPAGGVVSLCGTLGAGKTRLVQAVAVACGTNPADVVSPTFVLIHEYRGRRPVYHVDAYRVRDEDEFEQLGPDEYFEGEGITLVEWADRVERCMPRDRLDVLIEVTGEQSRRFTVRALGRFDRAILDRLTEKLTQRREDAKTQGKE
ncbi:MAG TPA: tRNA (adenosine(37)-N6)-threonylcarbamoyltransferase complex ATPase subunit type 1 TsaE [Thermoguttaceae bacterium]|nr:tRNA (adenosine(37)-N6)-threonylcarbamoyltransferase complex ATPase subunit type 1 TsaE [Thermoguttaceae bacterium]